eukprot:10082175-Prorocentrum_lima.AAC.1
MGNWHGTACRELEDGTDASVCLRLRGGDPSRDAIDMTADLDERFVSLVAQLGTVKNWALDQGNSDILALYHQADA